MESDLQTVEAEHVGGVDPPRPSVGFAVCSWLVIAGSAFVLATTISAAVVTGEPFAILGLFLIVPFFLLLILAQYQGTFRNDARGASGVRIPFWIVSGIALFGFVTTAGESIGEPRALKLMGSFLGTLIMVAIGGGVLAWWNGRWLRVLQSRGGDESGRGRKERGGAVDTLILVGVLAGAGIFSAYRVHTAPPRVAEHVEAAKAPVHLPEGATDVSYALWVRGTSAYEFTTDEAAFRAWVESGIGSIESEAAGVPLMEITEPHMILRFFFFADEIEGPKYNTIEEGLFYSWQHEDRSVHAVFDRRSGRGYYSAGYH